MTTDQVGTETQKRRHSDASGVIDSLSVREPISELRESMMDSILKESVGTESSGEGPFVRVLLTGLNWATYVLAAGVIVFLTWAARDVIRQYLGQ